MDVLNTLKLTYLSEWHRFIVWRIERAQLAQSRWQGREVRNEQRAASWRVDVGSMLRAIGLPS